MTYIQTQELRKTYQTKAGPVHALAGLDLSVEQGTIRALLGPNGAGKTTCVGVLTTLISPDAGRAQVAGIDVLAQPDQVRSLIGASGQYAAVDQELTARENLVLVGRLYHLGTRQARRRADELLESFDLTQAANRPLKGFSGGMRRRIDLAGALVAEPEVLFLDEPTTGLDPKARLGLWQVIRERVVEGTTVLLTTQYLEEADHLADEISVIDSGHVIAEGTADQLKARVGGQRIQLTLVHQAEVPQATKILAGHASGEVATTGRTLTAQVADPSAALMAVLAALSAHQIDLHDAGIRRPTLDDVFLSLTGHAAKEDS